jgi:hypothetical protein
MSTRLEEIEDGIFVKLEESFKANIIKLQNPDRIFFTSWTFTQPEGRMTQIWKNEGGKITKDEERTNLMRIWSFVFPEMREDYLVERTWRWMTDNMLSSHSELICFHADVPKANIHKGITITKKFKKELNGSDLIEKINNALKIQRAFLQDAKKKIDPLEFNLKIARILKHDLNFNKTQIEGIDKAFSEWLKNPQTSIALKPLFSNLYGLADPARSPLEARKFLTMWQNFSVITPDLNYIALGFDIPFSEQKDYQPPEKQNDLRPRFAVALFYKNKPDRIDTIIETIKEVIKPINVHFLQALLSLMLEEKDKDTNGVATQANEDDDRIWLPVKNRTENKQRWNTIVSKISGNRQSKLDNLLEIAGRLAFSTHEARPVRFAFIAGSEQIWPAIEETISLRFYEPNIMGGDGFDIKLLIQICEANYSIFQTERVVGFYNIESQSLHKILRLRYPSREELRLLEDPICDFDDLICWSITRIYEDTKGFEKSFIVLTQGDGKVLIYGLKQTDNKGDLLLIWDVRTGKLEEPIQPPKIKLIEAALQKINIDPTNSNYRKLIRCIRKISTTPGEGAALVIASGNNQINSYLTSMEHLKPSWLETLGLDDPQYILRSAFIMDGACLITKTDISPRLAIYPYFNNKAWGFGDIISLEKLANRRNLLYKKLSGKGSKTHASSNISTHPEVNKDLDNPEVFVISISADGPIKIWPSELLNE